MSSQILLPFLVLPVEPGESRILCVGVVVATLSAPCFITRCEHGDPCREQQSAEEVAHRLTSFSKNDGVFGRAFYSVVKRTVHVGAVAIVLAVGFVVFCVVGHEIV